LQGATGLLDCVTGDPQNRLSPTVESMAASLPKRAVGDQLVQLRGIFSTSSIKPMLNISSGFINTNPLDIFSQTGKTGLSPVLAFPPQFRHTF